MAYPLSSLLDLLLSLLCCYYALRLLLLRQDLTAAGYLTVSAAAFAGCLDYADVSHTRWIHDFLSAHSRLAGTLCMGLGIVCMLSGLSQRIALFIATFAFPLMYYCYVYYPAPLPGLYTAAALVLLIPVLVLAVRLWRGRALIAIGTVAGLLLTAALSLVPLPKDAFLRPQDIFHLSLMLAYSGLYIGITTYVQASSQTDTPNR
jgi:hypothetical protein